MTGISAVLQQATIFLLILSKASPWRRKLKPVHIFCFFTLPHAQVYLGEVQVSFIPNQSIPLKCYSRKQLYSQILDQTFKLFVYFTTKRAQTMKIQSSTFNDKNKPISSIFLHFNIFTEIHYNVLACSPMLCSFDRTL